MGFCFPVSQDNMGSTKLILLELWKIEDNLAESKIKPRLDRRIGQLPCCILPLETKQVRDPQNPCSAGADLVLP